MTAGPKNAAGMQRGRPFAPGKSGNPAGKPPGTRSRATALAERLMAGDAEAVVRAVLTAATLGDMVAARLVLDRIAPAPRGRYTRFPVPQIATAEDVAAAAQAVLQAAGDGVLTLDEAAAVSALIESRRRTLETADLADRIAAIEARQPPK